MCILARTHWDTGSIPVGPLGPFVLGSSYIGATQGSSEQVRSKEKGHLYFLASLMIFFFRFSRYWYQFTVEFSSKNQSSLNILKKWVSNYHFPVSKMTPYALVCMCCALIPDASFICRLTNTAAWQAVKQKRSPEILDVLYEQANVNTCQLV